MNSPNDDEGLTPEPVYTREDNGGWPQDCSPDLPFAAGCLLGLLQREFPHWQVHAPQGYAPLIDIKVGNTWLRLTVTELG